MPALAHRYDVFLLDLDGTLYSADRVIPGAVDAVHRLRAAGRRLVFVTNNSSRTPAQVAEKLTNLGIEAAPEEVETSALATATLLAAAGGGSAFVVGEDGIREALREAGLTLLEGEPERADHVVMGWDRSADYAKLRTACLLVQRGARLVATNADASYPAPDGLWPGAGALLAVVVTTTGVTPEVVGKPGTRLYEDALKRGGGGTPLVVGDRIDTDIVGAVALGWDSLLVLTGISTRQDLAGSKVRPTYVADDLSALFEASPEPAG